MTDSIRDRDRIRQIKRFGGLRFERNIAPTDIDAFLEFGNELFIFIETKYGRTALPAGQRLALERLCDACASSTRKSILLLTSHTESGDIDLARTRVEKAREDGKWMEGDGRELRAVIDELVLRHAPKYAAAASRPGLRKAAPLPPRKKSSATG